MIGILTKVDLVNDPDQLAHIHQQLKNAGAKEIFEVSSVEKRVYKN